MSAVIILDENHRLNSWRNRFNFCNKSNPSLSPSWNLIFDRQWRYANNNVVTYIVWFSFEFLRQRLYHWFSKLLDCWIFWLDQFLFFNISYWHFGNGKWFPIYLFLPNISPPSPTLQRLQQVLFMFCFYFRIKSVTRIRDKSIKLSQNL